MTGLCVSFPPCYSRGAKDFSGCRTWRSATAPALLGPGDTDLHAPPSFIASDTTCVLPHAAHYATYALLKTPFATFSTAVTTVRSGCFVARLQRLLLAYAPRLVRARCRAAPPAYAFAFGLTLLSVTHLSHLRTLLTSSMHCSGVIWCRYNLHLAFFAVERINACTHTYRPF